jgi:DNA-binding PadR family transcriptional regulator
MMMKEGLVKKRMWRIRGGKRRVMVYLLTDKGRIIANLMITNVMK